MPQPRAGLTLVEVLVAVVVLTFGVLALVGSWAHTTRMLAFGRQSTAAAFAARDRVGRLQHIARSTIPPCTSPEWRDGVDSAHGLVQRWRILDPAGAVRRIELVMGVRRPSGWSADTVTAAAWCPP